jgi:hypothetical protein
MTKKLSLSRIVANSISSWKTHNLSNIDGYVHELLTDRFNKIIFSALGISDRWSELEIDNDGLFVSLTKEHINMAASKVLAEIKPTTFSFTAKQLKELRDSYKTIVLDRAYALLTEQAEEHANNLIHELISDGLEKEISEEVKKKIKE